MKKRKNKKKKRKLSDNVKLFLSHEIQVVNNIYKHSLFEGS